MEENKEVSPLLEGRCFCCKYWEKQYYVLQGFDSNYAVCNIANGIASEGFMEAICSSEGIGGELITRQDFGCLLYNAR